MRKILISQNVVFIMGKKMNLSVELSITSTKEIARKLLNNVDQVLDVHFTKKKTLYEIGWCSNYMLDKRYLESCYLIEFTQLNIYPTHRLFNKESENFQFLTFSLCYCFNCQYILRCLEG